LFASGFASGIDSLFTVSANNSAKLLISAVARNHDPRMACLNSCKIGWLKLIIIARSAPGGHAVIYVGCLYEFILSVAGMSKRAHPSFAGRRIINLLPCF
jgi:hypothetical protein